MSSDLMKRQDDLLRVLESNGYTVERGNHIKVRGDGKEQVVAGSSPSDIRAIKNFKSELRRKGYVTTATPTRRNPNKFGKLGPPPKKLRQDLRRLLTELGEDPNLDPHRRGSRGGARKVVATRMKAVYARQGLQVPVTDEAYTGVIRAILAGDTMGQTKIDVMTETVADLLGASDASVHVLENGKPTRYRCNICNQYKQTLEELSDHQRLFHGQGQSLRSLPSPIPVPEDMRSTLADELYAQVLAAILDPGATREEAFDLAEKVRNLT